MSKGTYEADVEELALAQLAALGCDCIHCEDIAPGASAAERVNIGEVVRRGRLEEALRRLNPDVPEAATNEGLRKLLLLLAADWTGA